MKKNTEYMIYGGLAIISIVGLVYLFRKDEKTPSKEEDIINPDTGTGDITKEQQTKDPLLEDLMKTPNWASKVVGKKIFTKVGGANIRTQSFVNNGLINNIYGTIPSKGIEIGEVTKVIPKSTADQMAWFGVKLSKQAYTIIQSEKNIITRDIWENIPPLLWVREDVVKLA